MNATRTAISGLLLLSGLILICVAALSEEKPPVGPAVYRGRLDNGLVYYIEHNTKPEKQVERRLVVNAGSVQEDADQRGAAHIVEHIAFRGTKRFPGLDLVHDLQSMGANFIADANAHTSFDEPFMASQYRPTRVTRSGAGSRC